MELTAVMYPAACQSWVIAVGATDIHNQIPASSLSGPQLDVVAPGEAREDGQPDKGQILSANIAGVPNTGLVVYGRGHGTN